jgi:Zn-dependent protease with chaperone function
MLGQYVGVTYLRFPEDPSFLVAAGLWLLVGLLAVTPVLEPVVTAMQGARRPREHERGLLDREYAVVCSGIGIDPGRFRLRVATSPELNAFAFGYRTITVTTTALQLEPAHLRGILAHEVAHHARGHALAAWFGFYLAWPTLMLTSLAMAVARLAWRMSVGWFLGSLRAGSIILALLALPVMAFIGALAFYFAIPLLVLIGLRWLARAGMRMSESEADERATTWGFGPELYGAFLEFIRMEGQPVDEPVLARFEATHPPTRDRATAIYDQLSGSPSLPEGAAADSWSGTDARSPLASPGTGPTPSPGRAPGGSPRDTRNHGTSSLPPELRPWFLARLPEWAATVQTQGPHVSVFYGADGSSRGGRWWVTVGPQGHQLPMDLPSGVGSHGPATAGARIAVLRAVFEELGVPGIIHVFSREDRKEYRTVRVNC